MVEVMVEVLVEELEAPISLGIEKFATDLLLDRK